MDRFTWRNTTDDGQTVYTAPHEVHNEVTIIFPDGYWDSWGRVPLEIDIKDFSVQLHSQGARG